MAHGQRVIFLDVGNVLIDDDPFLAEGFRLIHQAIPRDSPKSSLERFWGDVERALRAYGHMAVERVGMRCHGRHWPKIRKRLQREVRGKWWDLARMIPGAAAALEHLQQEYRLGIIANQPLQVLELLDRRGMLSLFEVVILDSEHGVAKPNPTLFRVGLEKARVDPDLSIMVGDRLDNDVIPARRLGMRAVLLWLDVRDKGWEPQDEWGWAFWKILQRLPLPRCEEMPPNDRPMALVRRWEELPAALEEAWAEIV